MNIFYEKYFADELCVYLAQELGLKYGDEKSDLKLGELIRGVDGVYAIEVPTSQSDIDSPIEYKQLDFWSRYANTQDAYNHIEKIRQLLHRKYSYETTNYEIYFSYAIGNIDDQDRDGEGCKLFRIGISFIVRNKNIIS